VSAANRYADTKELWRARAKERQLDTSDAGQEEQEEQHAAARHADGVRDTVNPSSRRRRAGDDKQGDEWNADTFFGSKHKRGEWHEGQGLGREGPSSPQWRVSLVVRRWWQRCDAF
jgi:hypothetical protein